MYLHNMKKKKKRSLFPYKKLTIANNGLLAEYLMLMCFRGAQLKGRDG